MGGGGLSTSRGSTGAPIRFIVWNGAFGAQQNVSAALIYGAATKLTGRWSRPMPWNCCDMLSTCWPG